MDRTKSVHTAVSQFFVLMKLAKRLSIKPSQKRTIVNELACDERTFYRKVKDLQDLGINVQCEAGIWYIEDLDENIINLFYSVLRFEQGKKIKNERVTEIKRRRFSKNPGAGKAA